MGIEKNANIGGDLTVAGISTFTGLIDANGIIEGISGQNKIPSLYANYSDLPNAGTYHGMFAHVHAVGKGFFAHAGNWIELVSKETSGTVGTGTETYNIAGLTATGATIDSVKIGITAANEIDTSSGNLILDSAGGTVEITDNLTVSGTNILEKLLAAMVLN